MEQKGSMCKVGDKVVIAQRKGKGEDYPYCFNGLMVPYSGKIATIRQVIDRSKRLFLEKNYNGDHYLYKLEEFDFSWHSSMFEPYKENDKTNNTMEQKTIIIDGVEYICTPKQSEQLAEIKRWRDDKDAKLEGYFIGGNSDVLYMSLNINDKNNHNVFATEKQAKSALAMAQITQIMENDARFGGLVTDEEWQNDNQPKFTLVRVANEIKADWASRFYCLLAFHTPKQRELFLRENEDLIKDYLMLD